jgi:aldehyde:ferredoxin oxidoreductase
MKIIEKEFNAITGETTITEREETTGERQFRLDSALKLKEQAEAEADKLAARSAVLTKLGLTAEEAQALLG